jgi:hypothetical protein
VPVEIAAPEELIAAAYREERRACADRGFDPRPFRDQVRRDQRLLAVLAAADVEQVVLSCPDLVADRDRSDLELVPAARCTPGEDGDVPAICVDVQVVRIQMPDANLQDRSQYGFA